MDFTPRASPSDSSRIDFIAMLLSSKTLALHRRRRQQPWWRWSPQRCLVKVRLKWVKNRGLDHIIDRDTNVKAACLLKDAIAAAPSGLLSARSLAPLQKNLGLTVPLLRFLRRYPTLFDEQPHPRFPSLPAFSLAPASLLLHRREQDAFVSTLPDDSAHRLARLLMMARSRALPVASISPLRYDLGLPSNFSSALPAARPDLFTLSRRRSDGAPVLSLTAWPEHLAVSALQIRHRDALAQPSTAPLVFPMKFPRDYGSMNKVKAWMEDFHRLPYVSPYEDTSGIDPGSDLMEKHVVGVLHEFLSLTIHKKTKRTYLRSLREELGLPHKFTRIFNRYSGIFYLSLKCKTITVVLREGYERGKLVEQHPLALLRDKCYYVMRTGILYRGKGCSKLAFEEDDDLFGERNSKHNDFDEAEADADDSSDEEEYYELDDSDAEG